MEETETQLREPLERAGLWMLLETWHNVLLPSDLVCKMLWIRLIYV